MQRLHSNFKQSNVRFVNEIIFSLLIAFESKLLYKNDAIFVFQDLIILLKYVVFLSGDNLIQNFIQRLRYISSHGRVLYLILQYLKLAHKLIIRILLITLLLRLLRFNLCWSLRRQVDWLRNTWILLIPLLSNKRISRLLFRIGLVYPWLKLLSSVKWLKLILVGKLKRCVRSWLRKIINFRVARCFGLCLVWFATPWSRNRR